MPRPPLPTIGEDTRTWGHKNNAVLEDAQQSLDRVDPGTALAADEVVTGDGAGNPVKRTFREIGVPWVNPRSAGLSLDGTTDEAAAFQAFVDGLSAGTVIGFDDGAVLRADSQITFDKRIDIAGHGGATIQSNTVLDAPLIRYDNANDVQVTGVAIVGAETSFANTETSQAWAMQFASCDRAVVERVAMSGFSRGLNVFGSDHVTIDTLAFLGLQTEIQTWSANGMTVRFLQSDYPRASNILGQNCGSAFYAASGTVGGSLHAINAINCWDNGVYIFSGDGWDIGGVQARMTATLGSVTNTGVKVRGSRNKVHNCDVVGYVTGYVLTGQTTVEDDEGAEGNGSSLEFCTSVNAHRHGAIIESSNGNHPPRDFAIRFCTFEASGQATGNYASVRVTAGNGHELIGNKVLRQVGEAPGFLIQGVDSTHRASGLTVAFNDVRDMPNVSAATPYRINWVDNSLFAFNRMEDAPGTVYGMNVFESNNNTITGTRIAGTVGTTSHIRTNGNNNRIYDNPQATITDTGSGTIKYGNSNGNPVVTGATDADKLASLISILQTQKKIG